jgi:hypothetical protein
MPCSTVITPAILDKVLSLLVPLFLTDTDPDLLAARHAASRLLAAYNAETEEELRLAAEIISFGFGALDALAKSMAPGLTMSTVLRLRGSANAQHRSANQCQRTFDKVRKERRIGAAGASRQAREVAPEQPVSADPLMSGDDAQPTRQPIPVVSQSRQQRRAAERKAEKTHRKQLGLARREAMRTLRSAPGATAGMCRCAQSPGQTLAA